MINVVFYSINPDTPPRGYWDMAMLEDVFSHDIWQPVNGYDYRTIEAVGDFPNVPGAVIVFPARAQVDYVDELNRQIAKLKWVVLILTGDEENDFPVEKIKHKNIKIWVMSPRPGRHDEYRKLGTGYASEAVKGKRKRPMVEKDLDYFFSGQVTHERRQALVKQLNLMPNGKFLSTEGFTQGFDPKDYYSFMLRAKTAPAPSGPITPDSFRLFEALEAGAVPIADTRTPKGDFPDDYWTWFFDEEPPFPVLTEYEQLPGYTEDSLKEYPKLNNRIFAWWQQKKRKMAYDLVDDLKALKVFDKRIERLGDKFTAIIPTSFIPSCPDTKFIEQTIDSIRTLYSDIEIIVTIDGLREEHQDRAADYHEYTQRLLYLLNTKYHNVLPIIFDENTHQVGMARVALKQVKTPFILYVEHDTPLVTDEPIDTTRILNVLASGDLNIVRLHFEAVIPEEHKEMMLDDKPRKMHGCPIIRTAQYSQRPHFASKAFYDRITAEYFSENARTFYEDLLHGKVIQDYRLNGIQGWYNWRVGIYAPEGNYKRSWHSDGREGTEKYDKDLIF